MSSIRLEKCGIAINVSRKRLNFSSALIKNTVGGVINDETKNSRKAIVRPLSNISLDINEGERVAFLGHNGAGKTTLLKLLCGVYEPSSGIVEVKGKVSPLINLGLGIDPDLTGYENVILKYTYMGLSKELARQNSERIFEFSELGEFFGLPVSKYSDGMKARLSFAIATSVQPEILVMDEWIGAGDEVFRSKASKRVDEIAQKSGIIIFATHSAMVIEKWATRVIWLEKGGIRMDGKVEDVLPSYQEDVRQKIKRN